MVPSLLLPPLLKRPGPAVGENSTPLPITSSFLLFEKKPVPLDRLFHLLGFYNNPAAPEHLRHRFRVSTYMWYWHKGGSRQKCGTCFSKPSPSQFPGIALS